MDKKQVIIEWAGSEDRSGTIEAQVGLLTERIKQIAAHIDSNHKDYSSKLGLLKLVCKRRRLLKYLDINAPEKAQLLQAKIKN